MAQKVLTVFNLKKGGRVSFPGPHSQVVVLIFVDLKCIRDRIYVYFEPSEGLAPADRPPMVYRHIVNDDGEREIWELDEVDTGYLLEEVKVMAAAGGKQ